VGFLRSKDVRNKQRKRAMKGEKRQEKLGQEKKVLQLSANIEHTMKAEAK